MENGVLILHYSLVAASVPGLTNLHMRPSLQLEIVDDPEFNRFSSIVTYQPGSNKTLMISVSHLANVMYICVELILMQSIHFGLSFKPYHDAIVFFLMFYR